MFRPSWLLGRSPVHMVLLQETDLAALFIDEAVAALRADDWGIVTADEAYAVPIAGIEPTPTFSATAASSPSRRRQDARRPS